MDVKPISSLPDAMASSLRGMQAERGRLDQAAHRIANGDPHLARNLVGLAEARHAHAANVATAKVAGDMYDATIDLLA